MQKLFLLAITILLIGDVNGQIPEGEYAITATSTLPASTGSDYAPDNLMDGGPASWSEGTKGNGIGEKLQLYLRYPDHLKYIMIKNGFGKPRYWAANARVRELKILTSSGREYYLELEDTSAPQVFGMFEPIADQDGRMAAGEVPYDSAFNFEIIDVYPGNRWEDLCITEIGLNQWYYDAFEMRPEYIYKCLYMDFLGGVLDTHGDLFYKTDFEGLKQAVIIDGYLEKEILSGDGTSGRQQYQVLLDTIGDNYYIFHAKVVSEISQESMEGKMDDFGEPFRSETRTWGIAAYDPVYGRYSFLDHEVADTLFEVTPVEVFSRKQGFQATEENIWMYIDAPGKIGAVFTSNKKEPSPDTIYYQWHGGKLDLLYLD